jgi:hypothetical protein
MAVSLVGLVAGCGDSGGPSVPASGTAAGTAPPASSGAPKVGSGRKTATGSEKPGGLNTGIAP